MPVQLIRYRGYAEDNTRLHEEHWEIPEHIADSFAHAFREDVPEIKIPLIIEHLKAEGAKPCNGPDGAAAKAIMDFDSEADLNDHLNGDPLLVPRPVREEYVDKNGDPKMEIGYDRHGDPAHVIFYKGGKKILHSFSGNFSPDLRRQNLRELVQEKDQDVVRINLYSQKSERKLQAS